MRSHRILVRVAALALLAAPTLSPATAQAAAAAPTAKALGSCWVLHPAGQAATYNHRLAHGGDGSLWGTINGVAGAGWEVARWDGSQWIGYGRRYADVDIAVSPSGQPWTVDGQFRIWRLVGNVWEQVPGSAYNIDIGADGSIWSVKPTDSDWIWGLQRWDGSGWTDVPTPAAGATRVAVDRFGRPWISTGDNKMYRLVNGFVWEQIENVGGSWVWEIQIGGPGTIYGEQAWRLVYRGSFGSADVMQRWNGSTWVGVEGSASGLSIDRDGRAWHSAADGLNVFYWNCG